MKKSRQHIYPAQSTQLKLALSLAFFFLLAWPIFAQGELYNQKVNMGATHLVEGEYAKAAKCYSDAFQLINSRGYLVDRLNAARAWAMAGNQDSAYFNLFLMVEKFQYSNLEELSTDKYLQPMHSDARWPTLYERVEKNANSYPNMVLNGRRFFNAGKYAEAAKSYSDAFQASGGQGSIHDRLNAARAWVKVGALDSAYFNLFRITELAIDNFQAEHVYKGFLEALNTDKYLEPMHSDTRWPDLLERANAKMPRMPELAAQLLKVLEQDQSLRLKTDSIERQYGGNSAELKRHWEFIMMQDSINLEFVTGILDRYGWLGTKAVGWAGSEAIFLVVQHADLPVQEKYLPMMREAVITGNAKASLLAHLEDRVLTRSGKKQRYGTQFTRDPETNETLFYPIEDVDNVDKRRNLVGLGPLAEYAEYFGGFKWDAEAIEKNKKMLPRVKKQK